MIGLFVQGIDENTDFFYYLDGTKTLRHNQCESCLLIRPDTRRGDGWLPSFSPSHPAHAPKTFSGFIKSATAPAASCPDLGCWRKRRQWPDSHTARRPSKVPSATAPHCPFLPVWGYYRSFCRPFLGRESSQDQRFLFGNTRNDMK